MPEDRNYRHHNEMYKMLSKVINDRIESLKDILEYTPQKDSFNRRKLSRIIEALETAQKEIRYNDGLDKT